MNSPAERYAAAKIRNSFQSTNDFAASFNFPLDDFQVSGCHSLESGRGVLVAAPTGAGKTVVGEFAGPGKEMFLHRAYKGVIKSKVL
jgi:ATP-dependent RNA helicase HelY